MDGVDSTASGSQLPLPILLFVTAISALILILSLRRAGSSQGCFLVFAVWLRVICGAYPSITFIPVVAGLSINALLSVAFTAVGILIVSKDTFAQRWIIPFYGLIGIMMVSTAINQSLSGFVDMSMKWTFCIVMIAATRDAMLRVGVSRIVTLVAYCYAPIFILQFLSLLLGIGKATELDGSISYIGGYNHESLFSVLSATFTLLIYLNDRIRFLFKSLFISMGIISIFLANYRTAILAVLPLIVGMFVIEGATQFNRKSRTFIFILMIPLAMLIATIGLDSLSERFADLGTVFSESEKFLKPPSEYSYEAKRVLSGRLYIWSEYINAYLNSSDMQLLFGLGPNSWIGVFKLYAHNTIVSFIYELGLLGVLNLLLIWATFIFATLQLRDPIMRLKILLAQSGFLLFNFATMPHWQIEGMIMFSLLQGTLLYQLAPKSSPRPRVQDRGRATTHNNQRHVVLDLETR